MWLYPATFESANEGTGGLVGMSLKMGCERGQLQANCCCCWVRCAMQNTPVYEEMKPVLEEAIYEKMDVPSEVAADLVVQD